MNRVYASKEVPAKGDLIRPIVGKDCDRIVEGIGSQGLFIGGVDTEKNPENYTLVRRGPGMIQEMAAPFGSHPHTPTHRHSVEEHLGGAGDPKPDFLYAITGMGDSLKDSDPAVRPHHYLQFKIEPIRFGVENYGRGILVVKIIKYIVRAPFKGSSSQDLAKAARCLEMLTRFDAGEPDWWRPS